MNQSDSILLNCSFELNGADFAGGLWCRSGSPAFTNCQFLGNTATRSAGGLFVDDESPAAATLSGTKVCSNTPDQIAGPADLDGDGTVDSFDLTIFFCN